MNTIKLIHFAVGLVALASGALAFSVRKGGGAHISAGTWFCIAMFALGVTASILSPFKSPPDSPIGGIMVCYFVATAWMTARRRSGTPGTFEKFACAIIMVIAFAMIGAGLKAAISPADQVTGPPGPAVLIATGGICLLAGLLDLRFIIRGRLSATQRISRHIWRMCFAFFIATGSFFLGQQKVLPQIVRGSPILFVLAFAPFALMVFWLVRVRFSKTISRLKLGEAAARIPPEGMADG